MIFPHSIKRHLWLITGLLLIALATGCEQPEQAATKTDTATGVEPAYPHAGLYESISLGVYADGDTLHLLTAGRAPDSDSLALFYTRSDDGGRSWSKPVTLPQAEGTQIYLTGHGGHPPQIAAAGAQVVAVWAIHGDGWRGAGPLVSARSDDGGQTWQTGPGPADDNAGAAQNFHDIAVDHDGRFHAVWLDSRNGNQALYHANSDDGGRSWTTDRQLDERTCECCRNTLAVGEDDTLHVLYRDRDPRDMALSRSDDSGMNWQRAATVGAFDWHFDGCPHTGGGLAAAGEHLYATVWTGADDHLGAYLIHSDDGGRNWSAPQRLGNKRARHTDVAAADSGEMVAVWDAGEGDTLAIHMATSHDGATSWQKQTVLQRSRQHLAQPRVVSAGSGFLVLWLEQQPDGRSVWASLRVTVTAGD